MNFKNDLELLEDFSTNRNLKKISKKTYNTSINLYSNFNNAQFIDLLKEAETEETSQIRWKERKLKQRLLNFRNFLTRNYQKNYSRITFSRILTIYRHYDIEVHDLPPQSSKNYNEPVPITFKDLPTKNIIKRALNITTPVMRALILFMTSSGCARQESLNLTVNDFISATKEYHDSSDIWEIIKILEKKNHVIPTFKLKRQKTNKYYFTFCSGEATNEIISYLKTRPALKLTDNLFKIHPASVTRNFIKINNHLKLGKIGSYNRFRSHNLRKFHASNLKNDGMLIDDINSLQGKSRNAVDGAYYFENPERLKAIYLAHVNAVTVDEKNMPKIRCENKIIKMANT